jgi:TIR domain
LTDRLDFFISYARADDPTFAAELDSILIRQGQRVWWDKEKMPSRGETFLHEIREAIVASTRVIVIIGPAGSRSDYVRCEWRYAPSLSKPVRPLLRQGSIDDVPPELRLFHTPDVRTRDALASSCSEINRILSEPLTCGEYRVFRPSSSRRSGRRESVCEIAPGADQPHCGR